jgi:hypothetical protein
LRSETNEFQVWNDDVDDDCGTALLGLVPPIDSRFLPAGTTNSIAG